MHETQLQKVLAKLNQDGFVDNFWAIQNYILRLGAIIHDLRRKGMEFEGKFGKELGESQAMWKNYYYIKVSKPIQNTLI